MRQPTYYISHGGGPWPYVSGPMREFHAQLETALRDMPHQLASRPKAVLMISAHWEEREFTVMAQAQPGMLYDYGGFPPETYEVHYRAPGSPELAQRVQALLQAAGVPCATDTQRGFDHGAFVPMAMIYPEADVPLVQLSLKAGLDPRMHLAIGRALTPLRDEGVLIVGSGASFHSFRVRGPAATTASKAFDTWLTHTLIASSGDTRAEQIERWAEAPSARIAHAREEHLLPLMVALGAAHGGEAKRVYHQDDLFGGTSVSSFRFD